MKFLHTTTVPATRERVWALVTDVPSAARCVPGVAAVTPAGSDKFRGSLMVQIGPVRLVLDGEIGITKKDEAAGTASLRADAKDSRLGGTIRANADMTVTAKGDQSELRIATDLEIGGRIGEFGQPVIKRKADQLMKDFSDCLARTLAGMAR
jgi:carbon monoxide dehydrogenase subunit G